MYICNILKTNFVKTEDIKRRFIIHIETHTLKISNTA